MADAVKVAVRVRPFIHDYEKVEGIKCVVTMDKETQQTIIQNPETGKTKSFTFDFSYNSFLPEDDPNFASQDTVWQDLGVGVLENAWEGFNVSLFAYGQTGAGKSHSMMGYPGAEGIVPRACREIFQRITKCSDAEGSEGDAIQYKIEASMLEIYNEKVRDLFNPEEGGASGLKVRDHPKTGPYVQGLTKLAVNSYEGINEAMEAGTRARTVAATAMNATSSRAHTIFQILLTQTKVDKAAGKATDKVSIISLIDLAGSERANRTGAAGDRLKEGCAINQSLSSLGNVISALADKATDPRKSKIVVPYRSSALTHLLKNSLGGNAKTIMIAAISPSNVNYDETLGTLRYADRAKKIKNKAVVNEDPNVKLIRGLQEEIEALRLALQARESGGAASEMGRPTTAGAKAAAVDVDELRRKWEQEKEEELNRMKEQMLENQRLLIENEKTWDEKLQESAITTGTLTQQATSIDHEKGKRVPHLRNLNEDPQMSGVLWYFVEENGPTRVGRKDADTPQHIHLSGLGILKEHCILEYTDGFRVTLAPLGSARVYINGTKLDSEPGGKQSEIATSSTSAVELHHGDRIILGNNQAFVFHLPIESSKLNDIQHKQLEEKMTWEHAEREQSEAQMSKITEAERKARETAELEAKEMQRKVHELEKRMQRERDKAVKAAAAASEAERKRLQEKQRKLEEELKAQIQQTEALKERQEREQIRQRMLEDKVSKTIHLVDEANEMSEELAMKTVFSLQLVAKQTTGAPSPVKTSKSAIITTEVEEVEDSIRATMETEVCIRAELLGSDRPPSVWTHEKFVNRLYLMREMYQDFLEVGRDLALLHESYSDDLNPFVDPHEAQLIGKAYIMLDSLAYFFSIDDSPPIINFKGKSEGLVKVSIVFDEAQVEEIESRGTGTEEVTLEDILGEQLRMTVQIKRCKGLPPMLCDGVYISYKLGEEEYTTTPFKGRSINPEFRDSHSFKITVTEEFTQFVLSGGSMEIQVFGCPVLETPNKPGQDSPKKRAGSKSPSKRRRKKDQDRNTDTVRGLSTHQQLSPICDKDTTHSDIQEEAQADISSNGVCTNNGSHNGLNESKVGDALNQSKVGEVVANEGKIGEGLNESKTEDSCNTTRSPESPTKRRSSKEKLRSKKSVVAESKSGGGALPPILGASTESTNSAVVPHEVYQVACDKVKLLETDLVTLRDSKVELEARLEEQAKKLIQLEEMQATRVQEQSSLPATKSSKTTNGEPSNTDLSQKRVAELEKKQARIKELEEKVALFEASATELARSNPEAHKAVLAVAEKYRVPESSSVENGSASSGVKDSKSQATESTACVLQ